VQANQLGVLASVYLPLTLADDYVKKINAVTPEQVQEVARQCLQPMRLTTGILRPLPMSDAEKNRRQEAMQSIQQGGLR
jgi:zinc protease